MFKSALSWKSLKLLCKLFHSLGAATVKTGFSAVDFVIVLDFSNKSSLLERKEYKECFLTLTRWVKQTWIGIKIPMCVMGDEHADSLIL